MKTDGFFCPMTKAERVFGLLYIPFHAVGLPLLLGLLAGLGVLQAESVWLDFFLYAFGLLMILIFMNRFLRLSFHAAVDQFPKFLLTCLVGFGLYWVLSLLVNGGLLLLLGEENMLNPNSEAVNEILNQNIRITQATTVLLAPILEETLFRGALFGGLRKKNRFWAYAVTVLLFAFYHLWSWFVADYSPILWVYLLQYVPATVVLCYAYEKSGSLWCPIVLHMVINFLALQAQKLV